MYTTWQWPLAGFVENERGQRTAQKERVRRDHSLLLHPMRAMKSWLHVPARPSSPVGERAVLVYSIISPS